MTHFIWRLIMAGASLLTLFDDIAILLDDIAILAKVAAKKTAGVLGDDLALNAEQVSGVRAERELPVVWAVAKGSFINKLILVPTALAISAIIPWLITPLLMLGGAFLCYEGFEKIAHKILHGKDAEDAHHAEIIKAVSDHNIDMVEFEKNKIKGAIRTDFILSAEIIVIALGVVSQSPFITQVIVVSIIAVAITVFVYGLVAGIVKIDDAGLYLLKTKANSAWGGFKRFIGRSLLRIAPILMKTLTIVGTAAMFLVGGGILAHGIPPLHHFIQQAESSAHQIAEIGHILSAIVPTLLNGIFGIIAGGILVLVISSGLGLYKKITQ
jgi:predicted DNA repair protein MutK